MTSPGKTRATPPTAGKGRHRDGANEAGFSLLEVLLAVVLLMGVMVASSTLVATALQTSGNSRMRLLATEVASSSLDCALASLNVTTFPSPAPCNEPASLISEMGLSGIGTSPALNTITQGGTTFTVEQQVNPGNSACSASSGAGAAPPELEVTDWVTWVSGATAASYWWQPGNAVNTNMTGRYVEESTLVAVPATALNPNDGSLLLKLTDDSLNGQSDVVVTVTGPSPSTTTVTATTTSLGCALFVNLAPGQYNLSATRAGWVDSLDDYTAGSPSPFTGTATVAAGTTTTLSTPYYAQGASVSASYNVGNLNGATPPTPTGTASLPVSLYNAGEGTNNPFVTTLPATVYPWSYQMVAGGCGSDSIPDGVWATKTPLNDGFALPTAGPGSVGNTGTITLSPIVVDVTFSGTQESGATVTAAPLQPQGGRPQTAQRRCAPPRWVWGRPRVRRPGRWVEQAAWPYLPVQTRASQVQATTSHLQPSLAR